VTVTARVECSSDGTSQTGLSAVTPCSKDERAEEAVGLLRRKGLVRQFLPMGEGLSGARSPHKADVSLLSGQESLGQVKEGGGQG